MLLFLFLLLLFKEMVIMKCSRYLIFLFLLVLIRPAMPAVKPDTAWVDSVYRSLTWEQRIAQLMIIRVYSCKDSIYNDSLLTIIRLINPGGVCFFKGTPFKQAMLTNRFQAASLTPLLVATDAEWGLGMRLDSCLSYPRQIALGAVDNDSLLYRMGRNIAKSCHRMGIHVNFAPVADINNNPSNPVIGFRSFGENPEPVARKSILYMEGLRDGGILSTAKHFPGHGDTETDSHLDLPVIGHAVQRLDSVELYPFKSLIKKGLQGIMVAHLFIPAYDTARNTPATLSYPVVTQLLRDRLGFKEYIFTDALDMQGVTKFFQPGEIEIKALLAGNDFLLLPKDAVFAVKAMKVAMDSGIISSQLIEEKVRKALRLKYHMGLNRAKAVDLHHLFADLNGTREQALINTLTAASMTLVRNEIQIIPITGLNRRKIAVVSIGDSAETIFQKSAASYGRLFTFSIPGNPDQQVRKRLCQQLDDMDIVIAGVHNITSNVAENYGITESAIDLIDTLMQLNRTIVTVFGTPYSLSRFRGLARSEAILVAYQDNEVTEQSAAALIFGGIPARGKLPVTAGGFSSGNGEETEQTRLTTVLPEEIGLPSEDLKIIDSIAESGLASHAYPGCQVLLAKDGKIFYNKAFGHPGYDDTVAVTTRNLYDLASVTKVAATTLAVMKLCDEKKCRLDDTLGKYLPQTAGSNKSGLTIRAIMSHQAGLQDWIPFYKEVMAGNGPDPLVFEPDSSTGFPWPVANRLYIRADYPNLILQKIVSSPLRTEKSYKYSDLGFYLLMRMVENITGEPFEAYLQKNFYKPLGLQTMRFNPVRDLPQTDLIPTENDTVFRNQLIRGYVHDPGAAMMGGISGHAGLFSDSYDLAVILQMLLWKGSYGGHQYLSPETVDEFTRYQFPGSGNRRGAGFDKPMLKSVDNGPACNLASHDSFGHSGFTGTYIWADPCNGLVYVFLSNRVYPSAGNQKLSELNIRTNIHQSVYELLTKYNVK